MIKRLASRLFLSDWLPKTNPQSGQIGVVILLMMVIILTVGLSVAARTTEDVFLANQTSDSARVFNAAESGVDEAVSKLQTSFSPGGTLPTPGQITVNNSKVDYNITQASTLNAQVFEGNSVMVNIVDRTLTPEVGLLPSGGTRLLRVDWSDAAFDQPCTTLPAQPASLLFFIYSVSGGTTNVRTEAVQGCNRGDNLSVNAGTGNSPYRFYYNLPLQTGDLFVRIKPVYADTRLNVSGTGLSLPAENYIVNSSAKNNTGNETKKIQVNQSLPTAPSVFDYTIYSGQTIAKTP